jgi:hypothetical protein
MPRWAIFLIAVPLVLCVGCASAGYFVAWPWLSDQLHQGQEAVADEMTEAVFRSVARRIEAGDLSADGPTGGELVLFANDINVNNTSVPGEVGIETGTEGTWIYGIETEIRPTGVALLLPGVTYSGLPVVEDGQVVLTRIEAGADVLGFLFSKATFEESLEGGINRALALHELTPLSVTLGHAVMTIEVDSTSREGRIEGESSGRGNAEDGLGFGPSRRRSGGDR